MIEVTGQINSVQRQVGSRMLGAGEARSMTISQAYDAPPEDVWDACTNPERIPRWFLPVSGELRAGGRYQLEGNAGGKIERCDPPTGFAATWEFGGSVSWIEVRLTTTGEGGTRLELEHVVPVDDHWAQFGPGAVGIGWDMAIMGLATHLASGAAVDPGQAAQWVASEEGKRFITRSSERWRDANIAGGAPAPQARAAGRRATAAYTGEEVPPAAD
jgi:uncharacterized protein YndB with AHSA1/START domain